MTKQEIIALMLNNPYTKVRHTSFAPDEYIYCKEDGIIYDENGYVFEDWGSHCDGMRIRTENFWHDGWSVCNE